MSEPKSVTNKRLIETDEDFIVYPKMGNSIAKLLARHPDGVEDTTIIKCLQMTTEEFDTKYGEALEILREEMGVDT